MFFFFSSRRRHTRFDCDWSSDVCSSDLSKAHQQNARFFKRLAPQKWCVQFWCSSKPGGVMFPPELVELTSFLYSQKLLDAREKLANPPTLSHRAAGVLLLDEKGLAQLIATDEGFHRPIAAEEILDFP